MRAAICALTILLLTGCSVQVTGMQSPVLHDHGSIDWIPVDRELRQLFIAGPGYSATIDNDPATTPDEYLDRNAVLPEDARTGRLERLRVGLRLAGRVDTGWDTGARIQVISADESSSPIVDVAVDELRRSGDRVIVADLPHVETGRTFEIAVIPGSGPDGDRLEIGVTPNRAPYGGWRATAGDETLRGALVFDTRYERDVAVGEIVGAGVNRLSDAGAGFLIVYGLVIGGLVAVAVYLIRPMTRELSRGR